MPTLLSKELAVQRVVSFGDGKKVTMKYTHPSDMDAIRTIVGTLNKIEDDRWVVRRSSTSYVTVMFDNIVSIDACVPSSRSHSEHREAADDVDVLDVQPTRPQPQAQQPSQEFNPATFMVEMMKMMTMQHQQAMQSNQSMMEVLREVASMRQPAQPTTQEPPRIATGNDVASLMTMGDALRGTENPPWRLAPGLILPRYLPQKFHIVSIPHLLFKEDPRTGEMVKVPNGTALNNYFAMLANCKMQFPNQVNFKLPKRSGDKKGKDDHQESNQQGIRAQIERAERALADLLGKLDETAASDLPTTKKDWMIFIDASVTVLEHYATLANGYQHGGGKLSHNYSIAITTTGKYDPTKLWAGTSSKEQDSFRF